MTECFPLAVAMQSGPKDINQLAKYIVDLSTDGMVAKKQLAAVKPLKKNASG